MYEEGTGTRVLVDDIENPSGTMLDAKNPDVSDIDVIDDALMTLFWVTVDNSGPFRWPLLPFLV